MPHALIITAAGINCDEELGRAFALAGAQPEFIHLNRLMQQPQLIDQFDLIGLPGGFSYGDAVAAGRIAAHLMRRTLYSSFIRAIERGTPIIAPCNGFQTAVQLGILPGPVAGANASWPSDPPRPVIALANNASARFVDRWCAVEVPANTRCIWTQGLESEPEVAMLPVAHGEGRFIPETDDLVHQLEDSGQVALRYKQGDNPNGSAADVAGICDASGLVFGLMPHPERYTRWELHPFWTRLNSRQKSGQPWGLRMFTNAVQHVITRKQSVAAR